MPPRSLFDRVDLAALRAAAGRLPGPAPAVLACLVGSGAVAHDPDDPRWYDRDRVLVGSDPLRAAAGAAGLPVEPPLPDADADADAPAGAARRAPRSAAPEPARALNAALEAAADSARDGDIYRVYCLLEGDACADGGVWEAALSASARRLSLLTAVICNPADPGAEAGRWRAAGWVCLEADGSEVGDVLSALDRSLAAAAPAAIVAAPP